MFALFIFMTGFHSLEDAEMVGEHLGKLFLGFKNSSTSKKIKVVVPLFIFVVFIGSVAFQCRQSDLSL
jgi:hypothetical protein